MTVRLRRYGRMHPHFMRFGGLIEASDLSLGDETQSRLHRSGTALMEIRDAKNLAEARKEVMGEMVFGKLPENDPRTP